MKAIIFNSGLGHRMGDETKTHHKSMTLLKNGETIFHRQLRLLSAEGVKDFKGRVQDGKVVEFIHKGEDRCYAENALNEIFPALNIRAFDYKDYYVDEIDNVEDWAVYMGAAIQAAVFGFVQERFGWPAIFVTIGCLYIIMLVLTLLARRMKMRRL